MSNLNIKNRTIFCRDNLDILQGINSDSVDLIYLDPPFNKNKKFTAPTVSSAKGAEFSDIFREEHVKNDWVETIGEDYDGIHKFLLNVRELSGFQSSKNKHYLYNYCYLCYMAIRLIEMHRILKDTGSIYLHCDNTMSHYLKILMDLIFGENNFRNEIIWCYEKPRSSKKIFRKNNDIIFLYTKANDYTFKIQRVPTLDGKFEKRKPFKRPDGTIWQPKEKGKQAGSWWYDIPSFATRMSSKERTGYPTQKPLKLLERIIQASSNEGDVVLDPFCGCATTCVAAEKLNRQWIGIDVSHMAYDLVKLRLKNEVKKDLFDPEKDVKYFTDPPKRTDTNGDERLKKYVYVVSHPQYKGLYKVGIAKDWKSRLNSYQTSDPLRQYKMEYKHLTPLFRETEKHIHDIFDNLGEWVQESLENIKKEIENYK